MKSRIKPPVKNRLSEATLQRLERGLEAYEAADPLTRRLILAELLGTSAYVVEVTQNMDHEKAVNVVLAQLEGKLAPEGQPQ